jgi:Fe-S-cluster containining protein
MTESRKGYSYDFDPEACRTCGGRCCNGESGNIWVNPREIEAISHLLGMAAQDFIELYLRKTGYRFSIKELKSDGNYSCVFYDSGRGGCTVYEARPEQCRTFPFWPYFKDNVAELLAECPGVTENEKRP